MTWTAGLAVALGAGVATAHGLFQVAAASGVPHPVAWLYPLITDGLALVAYAATARLHSAGRRYAAVVVVGAAGLSGLAQAVYLAGGITTHAAAPVGLRFGVGFWPAAAAAIAAHLLHLIGSGDDQAEAPAAAGVEDQRADQPAPELDSASTGPAYSRPFNPSNGPVFNPASNSAVQPRPIEPRTTPPVRPDPVAEPQPYNTAPGVNGEKRATGRPSAAERGRARPRRRRRPPRPHRRPAHRHRTDAPGRRRPRHRRNRPEGPPRPARTPAPGQPTAPERHPPMTNRPSNPQRKITKQTTDPAPRPTHHHQPRPPHQPANSRSKRPRTRNSTPMHREPPRLFRRLGLVDRPQAEGRC